MKKNLFIVITAALALVSCDEENLVNSPIVHQSNVLTATFEQEASATRMNIAVEGNALTWSEGDAIALINEGDFQDRYCLSTGAGTANGTFALEGETKLIGEALGAGFPYSGMQSITESKLLVHMPQIYSQTETLVGSIDLPMWGVIQDNNIAFKHLAGVLKVNLTDVPEGYNTLTAAASNPISGTFAADITVENPVLSSESTNEADKTVAVSFTAGASNTVYLPLPVGEYASIVVSVSKDGEDEIVLKNWTNKTVERAKIYSTSANLVWDGSTLVEVSDADAAASKVLYEVAHAEELAWVLRNWNGDVTSASRPTTIKLLNDIDFGGHEIYFDMENTPVSFHCVTLDGNNHAIKNYKVSGVKTSENGSGYKAGLFPQTSGVTIKDLIVDNAVVGNDQTATDLYSGALIGIATDQKPTPYTTVIENVTIQNSSISGVNKVGGLIGQANGIHTVSDVEVKNTTITGYGTDAGSLGGLYGYLKVEGESSFSSCTMTGGAIVCENGADVASRGSSGFIGTLGMSVANSFLALTDCFVSGTDLTKSNTKDPMNELIGSVRSGTAAILTIDGTEIDYNK